MSRDKLAIGDPSFYLPNYCKFPFAIVVPKEQNEIGFKQDALRRQKELPSLEPNNAGGTKTK